MQNKEHKGRPRKYPTPKHLSDKIDEYFAECEKPTEQIWVNKRGDTVKANVPTLPTVEGLVNFLGFSSRESLAYYETLDSQDDQEITNSTYLDALSRARRKMLSHWIEGAAAGRLDARTVALLMTNWGKYTYKQDKQVHHTGEVKVKNQVDLTSLTKVIESARGQIGANDPILIEDMSKSGGQN